MHQFAKPDDLRKTPRLTNQDYLYDIRSYSDYMKAIKAKRTIHSLPYQVTKSSVMYPLAYIHKEANFLPTKLVWAGINRLRSPIFAGKWLRDGVHLVTGSSNGELSLWNPLKFLQEVNFSAHESAVRAISVSYDGNWLITADHNGQIKYWQQNLNAVHTIIGHADPIRDLSFAPTDAKFASCGDDGLIKIWDFDTYACESSMQGHGTDVKCLDWHPHKGIIVSGSKDCQQPIMLWDPRLASALCTLHIHKNSIMGIKWSQSGNMFASASKDKTAKIFDLRAMKELQTLRGHKKEVYHVTWHAITDRFLSTGGVDGSLLHWIVGQEKELGGLDNAHDGVVWELSWHPEGHIFSSVSNDQSVKVWVRSESQTVPRSSTSAAARTNIPAESIDSFENCEDAILAPKIQAPIQPTIPSDGQAPSIKSKLNYPERVHRHFCCIPRDYDIPPPPQRYPIGKVPKPVTIPICEKEPVWDYIFNEEASFKSPSPLEYINIYDDDDDDIPPVHFQPPPKVLNYIPPELIDDLYRKSYNHESDDYSHTNSLENYSESRPWRSGHSPISNKRKRSVETPSDDIPYYETRSRESNHPRAKIRH